MARIPEGFAARVSQFFGPNLRVRNPALKKVGLGGVRAGRGKATITGPVGTTAANLHTGRGSGRRFISNKQYNELHAMRGRKIIAGGSAASVAGMTTAMRPNANQSRTGYRGPGTMQAPPGIGRFS